MTAKAGSDGWQQAQSTIDWTLLREPTPVSKPILSAPSSPRRPYAQVAALLILAAIVGVMAFGWDRVTRPVHDAPSVTPPVTVAPLAVQYVKTDASQRGYTIIRATVGAHPPIAPGHPTIITPNAADQQTRREFRTRCAACHDPYKGR